MAHLTYWLLDTRSLWPGDRIDQAAVAALALISPDERASACRKHFVQDARMALGSALLKRAFVAKTTGTPWRAIRFGRAGDPVHGKPCAVDAAGAPLPGVSFNVSHQAGLVALVGVAREGAECGVDVVCVNERNDYRVIDRDGFEGWVDMYEEIFSREELWDMKYCLPDGVQLLDGSWLEAEDLGRGDRCCRRDRTLRAVRRLEGGGTEGVEFSSELVVDAKLRRFYTYWCYKEAYIKLTGEALMASWLKQLEFRNVRAPRPGTVARCSTHGSWGEKVDDIEVWLHGKRVEDVRMEIQAFEEDRMISVAVKNVPGDIPPIHRVDLEQDILSLASQA
ncbi:putative 4 -phosphopantetheinyl transferase protein [Botryosphaeria dothidea]|uniref:holo-[acyl-carrier-protein] synthase n=1 Tax=Botryosphaeria dothidea TaxID=55169 RepID=A0A8H4N9J0_9PEZI|nr:putative 4 -phosphopantetheinyl transferase protein [Botryosphaeria dothidea]